MTENDTPPTPKRWRRWLLRGLLGLILAWLVFACGLSILIHAYGTVDRAENADAIIVLGAGVRRDGRPGPALTRRTLQAADLWKQGIASHIICTGGQAPMHPRSEADACREILLRQGIPETAILMEPQSRSTEENALYTRQILDEQDWETAVIVSDSYHVLRATWIFQMAGVHVSASPVGSGRVPSGFYIYSTAREVLALHWQVVKNALNLPFTHISGL